MIWTCEAGHTNEEPAIICTECGAAPFVKIPKDRPKKALHEPWPGTTPGEWLAHPHAGGCAGCREDKVCNVCGRPVLARTRCTNGRCPECHSRVCTSGGDRTLGHGYGDLAAAQRAAARRQK
jgi:DNA-directed RNA polymerase subunit RPC12/RpoP